MSEVEPDILGRRPAADFTDPQTMERIRSAFLGVDPDDAGPGIRRGRGGRPIITTSREVFEDLKAGRPVDGIDYMPFPED